MKKLKAHIKMFFMEAPGNTNSNGINISHRNTPTHSELNAIVILRQINSCAITAAE